MSSYSPAYAEVARTDAWVRQNPPPPGYVFASDYRSWALRVNDHMTTTLRYADDVVTRPYHSALGVMRQLMTSDPGAYDKAGVFYERALAVTESAMARTRVASEAEYRAPQVQAPDRSWLFWGVLAGVGALSIWLVGRSS